jgi:Tfp pilus assembly protein PilZ
MDRAALAGAPQGASEEAVVERVRIPFVQRASFTRRGESVPAFLVDLALSGAFVECGDVLEVGEPVGVRFRLPGNEIPIDARGRVAWRHRAGSTPGTLPTGVGVEFQELAAPARARLREYLEQYCRRKTKGRRFARQWPGHKGEDP